MFKWIVFVALALAASSAQAQTQVRVYSWTDASGRQHYSDRPPVGSEVQARQMKVAKPTANTEAVPTALPDNKAGADAMIAQQRTKDCEVARNNLNLLNDPNRQIVNQADPEAKPLDNAARVRARALAESQVQDFCSAR